MKIMCKKEDLVNGINTVQNAVSTKSTLPILSNILLDASNDILTLTGTDLDMGIMCKVPVKVSEPGALTIPAKKFADIIKELPDAEITIITKKNNTFTISCKTAVFKIMGLPKEDFPKFPDFKNKKTAKLEQAVLKNMISMTSFAVSKDETRYILNGVFFVIKDGVVKLVATDGRRLAMMEMEVAIPKAMDEHVIVPTKTMQELNKNLSDGGEVEVIFSENQILFNLGETVIISRLIEGEYPDYDQVIPKEGKNKVSVNREDLLLATKRVGLLTNLGSQAIQFDIHKNGVVISKNSPDIGEAKEELGASYSGSDLSIGFNPAYIIDVLKNIKDEGVVLELGTSAEKPGVIRTKDKYIYVVLPMQLT